MTEYRYKLAEGTITREDIQDLVDWLGAEVVPRLAQGELVLEFERVFAKWLGREHAVFCNSGSSANLLAYEALHEAGRIKRSTMAAVPAVSWATTVMPAIQLGLEPCMVDAEMQTLGMDPDHVEDLCRRDRVGMVALVHVLGVPAQVEAIADICKRREIPLLEDTCAAFGSGVSGRKVGTFGDLSTFSFYFGHHLSTIEGGFVTTDDPQLAEILRMIRAHGWAVDLSPARRAALFAGSGMPAFNEKFTFYRPGYNLRGTDLQARIGISQMARADSVVAARTLNNACYCPVLGASPHLTVFRNPLGSSSSIGFGVLAASELHRAKIAAALEEARIETRPIGGGNMARQPFWTDFCGGEEPTMLPVADAVHTRGFQLPNHQGMTPDDVQAICDVVLGVEP